MIEEVGCGFKFHLQPETFLPYQNQMLNGEDKKFTKYLLNPVIETKKVMTLQVDFRWLSEVIGYVVASLHSCNRDKANNH